MTEKEAISYANILNRLYSKEFRAYTRARLNTPNKYELKKLAKVAKAERELQAKIRHDAVVQELFDLAHHTRLREHNNKKGIVGYTTIIQPSQAQKRVKRLAQELSCLRHEESSADMSALLKKQQTVPITQGLIQAKFFYDPLTGEITHNEGAYADRSAVCIPKAAKKLKAQSRGRLPLRARNKPPTHIGYIACTVREWREEKAKAEASTKTCSENNNNNPIVERFYLERNSDKSSTFATIKKAYYVKRDTSKLTARVSVCTPTRQTSFQPQAIAYLYMGAGGRFDYVTLPNGDITTTRRSEESVQEPYGMKHIDPKTNKVTAFPCRDGNKFNYAWDNIKPDDIATSAATLTRIPKEPRVSPKEFTLVQSKRAYSIEACITGTRGAYIVQGIKGKPVSWSDWDSALECFHAQIKKLGGTAQRLRNGTVLVTRQVKEYTNNKSLQAPQGLTQGLD